MKRRAGQLITDREDVPCWRHLAPPAGSQEIQRILIEPLRWRRALLDETHSPIPNLLSSPHLHIDNHDACVEVRQLVLGFHWSLVGLEELGHMGYEDVTHSCQR